MYIITCNRIIVVFHNKIYKLWNNTVLSALYASILPMTGSTQCVFNIHLN